MEELPLLPLRILADVENVVTGRKNAVATGATTPELAALQVQHYGYGLAKALDIAEDLLGVPRSNLRPVVDRLAREIASVAII